MSKKSAITQKIVNIFPEWSDTRSDEQSLGFQFANTIGTQVEKLDKQLANIGKNYFLTTVNLNEIDLVHKLELEPSFEFGEDATDPANTIFVAPTVSGKIGSTWYTVNITDNNNIEDFWYNSIPTRINSTVTASGTQIVLSNTDVGDSPITAFDAEPHLPGKLFVTISGGNTFLSLENNQPARGLVILEGTTRQNTEESEAMVFLYDDTKSTFKEWQSLKSVSVFGVTPLTAQLSIRSGRFNFGPYVDFYNLEWSLGNEKVDTYWDIGTTSTGTRTLDLIRFTTDNFQNIVDGITDKEVVKQVELLDSSGNTYTPLDLAVQPFSNKIWVCSATKLYLYDNTQNYPDMRQMKKKQYDSLVAIQVDSYHKVLNDTVELSYIYRRPIKDVARHRVTMTRPDGTKSGIVDGSFVSTTTDYWDYGSIDTRQLRNQDIITLGSRGNYIFMLETVFTDGDISMHEVIVSVESKNALAEFVLDFTAVGVDFDSDQQLWVIGSDNIKHRIDLRTDIMLVDYEQKIIYLKEEYDQATVL